MQGGFGIESKPVVAVVVFVAVVAVVAVAAVSVVAVVVVAAAVSVSVSVRSSNGPFHGLSFVAAAAGVVAVAMAGSPL